MMIRVTLMTIGIALASAYPDFDMHKAHELMHGTHRCCKNELMKHPPPPPSFHEAMKECFRAAPKGMASCDVEICIATKRKFASSDGTIDKKALTELVAEDHKMQPDLVEAINKNCINGDISDYGKEDFCDLLKMKLCIEVQIIKSCDEWKDDDGCDAIKEKAEHVTEFFSA